MSMRITGDKKFMGELRKRRVRAREATRLGVGAGAMIIINAAKKNAPVLTGNLKRSLHMEPGGHGKDGMNMTNAKAKVEGNKIYADVGTDENYAATQEYEHTPYLRPAMDDNKDEYNKEVAETIKEVWK